MKKYNEWYEIVKPIINSEEFIKRKQFLHHNNTVYDHCLNVSYLAYIWAKKRNKSKYFIYNVSIAGLLHDFYPYPWQYTKELDKLDPIYLTYINKKHYNIFKKHGFRHAKEASNNSIIYYNEYLNKRIINSIKRHMFPLNIIPPLYKEGWLITYIDKKVSFSNLNIKDIPKYIGLKKKK